MQTRHPHHCQPQRLSHVRTATLAHQAATSLIALAALSAWVPPVRAVAPPAPTAIPCAVWMERSGHSKTIHVELPAPSAKSQGRGRFYVELSSEESDGLTVELPASRSMDGRQVLVPIRLATAGEARYRVRITDSGSSTAGDLEPYLYYDGLLRDLPSQAPSAACRDARKG